MKYLLILSIALLSLTTQAASFDPRYEPILLDVLRKQYGLEKDNASPTVVEEVVVSPANSSRERLSVTLEDGKLGRFRLLVEGPAGFSTGERRRPILFISAGFFSGTEPVRLFKDTGDFIIAAFEYAPNPEQLLRRPEEFSRTLIQVPGRLYLSVKWLTKQSWYDAGRLHIMGVSLGSLYLPVAVRLLQTDGFDLASYNTAFGGADVRDPLRNVLRGSLGERETKIVTDVVATALEPLNPSIYLPNITGLKLVIHGSQDQTFRSESRERLDRALKGPKMTCVIEGGHIDVDKPQEIRLTLSILRPWLTALELGRGLPRVTEPGTECRSEF